MLERKMGYVSNSSAARVLRAGSSCHAPQSNLTWCKRVLSSGGLVNSSWLSGKVEVGEGRLLFICSICSFNHSRFQAPT